MAETVHVNSLRKLTYGVDLDGWESNVNSWAMNCFLGECDFGLEWWHPEDFLNALPAPSGDPAVSAPEEHFSRASIEELRPKLAGGEDIDPLYLDIRSCDIDPKGETTHCMSHEGRHRAYVSRELGIEWVPVMVVRPKGHADMCKPCYRGKAKYV